MGLLPSILAGSSGWGFPDLGKFQPRRLLANLEMVEGCTSKALAMARQLSPAFRRLIASACRCSLSLDVPFVDARNSSGQFNPSRAVRS